MTIDQRPPLATLDAALVCAERGWHVIPVWRATNGKCPCPRGAQCVSPGKHPAIDSWQTAASTDLTVLRDWFSDDRHNIGVVCGPSGIVTIDIDPRNGGNETFAALVAELGELPPTVAADSGGGGAHYVFQRPQGDLVSKLGDGIELLRDSKQFLVEPSLHPSGNHYQWRTGHAPDEIAVAALPDNWARRIRQRPASRPSTQPPINTDARIERARKYLAKIAGAVSGDGGHTQTFNAVAHVMFGFDLDSDTTYSIIASDFNPRCDPPWSERELRHKIKSVAEKCKRERGYLLDATRQTVHTTQQASNRARPTETHSRPDDEENWLDLLITKKDGTIKRSYHNVEIFVRLYPDYRGRWSLNTMSGEACLDGASIRETVIHEIRAHADRRLGFTPSPADVTAAIAAAAEQRQFHPVRQYLQSVDWDGAPRLVHVARDYFGSDSALHAEMVRRWMIGAVARALQPGCKLDTALMLHGNQGYFKSTFFSVLGGAWHSDSAIDISNKDAYQQIHAAWIYEFSELENVVTGRAESRLKAFLTSTYDLFRAPYARAATSRPRSVALCGTTNRQEILTDDTGSRRFWIVHVSHHIDRDMLEHARDQLWAEARAAYEAGEPWWFDAELDDQRETANIDYEQDDPWQGPISEWLARPAVQVVTVSEVLSDAVRLEIARQDRAAQMRASKVLKRLGWRRKQKRDGTQRTWTYFRPSSQIEF